MSSAFNLLSPWSRALPGLALLSLLAAPAQALDNPRPITFVGQAVPAPAASVTVTSVNGSMTVAPHTATDGLFFPDAGPSWSPTYGLMQPNGTTILVTPASNAVPYQIDVRDQRASSVQYIWAECLPPHTTGDAYNSCNLGDTTLFPRTNYPVGAPPFTEIPVVSWDGTYLRISTPGAGNMQSNGLYIDLPPYVRQVQFTAYSSGGPESIFGTVRVADAPSVSKAFAPAQVMTGGQSTLTITLKHPMLNVAGDITGVNLTDLLPVPLQIVSASHTCAAGTLTAAAGSNSIALTNATLQQGGCQITAVVTWPDSAEGRSACTATPQLTNTITPPAQFNTAVGQLDTPATATLTCSGLKPLPPQTPTPVPTLDARALLLLLALIGLAGGGAMTRRKP